MFTSLVQGAILINLQKNDLGFEPQLTWRQSETKLFFFPHYPALTSDPDRYGTCVCVLSLERVVGASLMKMHEAPLRSTAGAS